MKRKSSTRRQRSATALGADAQRWLGPALIILLFLISGILAGGASPGGWLTWGWPFVYVPLFVALDRLRLAIPNRVGWWWALAGCWAVGVAQAALSGGWVVNTAHVYGHLPLTLAHGANLFGFGTLLGVETFLFLGVPFMLGWGRPRWGFFLVIFWSAALNALFPRFFYWTYGQFLHPVPLLTQIADVVGSAGLNLLVVPLHLLLFAWLRTAYAPPMVSRRVMTTASLAVAVMFAGAAGYGGWRTADLIQAGKNGDRVNLAALQPNFSLAHLASHPNLSHSTRQTSLNTLLTDTVRALELLGTAGDVPTVVVWPESVFPVRYFGSARVREAVEWWVQQRNLHLVLTSITRGTADGGDRGRRPLYGSSIHVAPDGSPPKVYNKIALIPFGETIPLGDWFPTWRRAIKRWIPQISHFDRGREYTVFTISDHIRLAPMICFDAVQDGVARGMVRNGANLGVVLANLAWFGRTNISELFEFYVRFRAIENRIPVLMLSQNGRSILLDAAGQPASPRLGLFEAELLPLQVKVPRTYSFFAHFSGLMHGIYAAATLALVGWRLRERRLSAPSRGRRSRK